MRTRAELEARRAELDGEILRLQAEMNTIVLSLNEVNDDEVRQKYGIDDDQEIAINALLLNWVSTSWDRDAINALATERRAFIVLHGDLDKVGLRFTYLDGRGYGGMENVPIEIAAYGRRMWLTDNA